MPQAIRGGGPGHRRGQEDMLGRVEAVKHPCRRAEPQQAQHPERRRWPRPDHHCSRQGRRKHGRRTSQKQIRHRRQYRACSVTSRRSLRVAGSWRRLYRGTDGQRSEKWNRRRCRTSWARRQRQVLRVQVFEGRVSPSTSGSIGGTILGMDERAGSAFDRVRRARRHRRGEFGRSMPMHPNCAKCRK